MQTIFSDPQNAQNILDRLQNRYGQDFTTLHPTLLFALGNAADPDRSLVFLERFAENYGPGLFAELTRNPRVIEMLMTLFSTSQFLTEILLRNPQTLSLLADRETLTHRKTIETYQTEAESLALSVSPSVDPLSSAEESVHPLEKSVDPIRSSVPHPLTPSVDPVDNLRRYQHAELLRIGVCDFLDLYDLPTVVSQLSRLANGLVGACLNLASQQTGISSAGFVVLAMGKFGGRELNYSSDVDLLFISRGDYEHYLPLAQRLIDNIASNTTEGFLYRVDMRLRPWGTDGPLVATLDGYLNYLQKSARLWEKQALLKIRPIAGDIALGEELREKIAPIIFSIPPEEVRASVLGMKQKTEQFLREKGRRWGEVKLGEGSIRDVEFVLQYLQLAHVHHLPQIRTRATLKGLSRLRVAGLITPVEARTLSDGYTFLRTIEHYLQMLDYRQTYTLPSDPRAIALLARRLGFQGPHAGEHFVARYQQHCQAIRAIFLRHVGSEQPAQAAPAEETQVTQHLARMDKSYAEAFTPEEVRQHAALANQLNESRQAVVDVVPIEHGRYQLTIVAYDYPGELSIICGLMFVYGLNIVDGDAFTYEAVAESAAPGGAKAPVYVKRSLPGSGFRRPPTAGSAGASAASPRRKIVDTFIVKPVRGIPAPDSERWERYSEDLNSLLKDMRTPEGRRAARGALAKRVGAIFATIQGRNVPLQPVLIEIDNETSSRYTLLRIEAPDTVGFLYELTNALAFYHVYISQMVIQSIGKRASDIFYVTDGNGNKITDPQRQRELRAAIVLIKHFTHLLPHSPNPASALLHFREFIEQLFQRPNWADELTQIERPDVLANLAHLLGVSDFLWADFMRMQYANLFPVVSDMDALRTAKSRAQLQQELEDALRPIHDGPQRPREDAPWRKLLNEFKDREMFRIDMRHILGHTAEFWDFSTELTDLSEVLVNAAYHLTAEDLRAVYGAPRREDGDISQMTVVALGKCGGRELGFASDIELMLIYEGEGLTDGPERIQTSLFQELVVKNFLSAIQARREGIFHVDLQLRPYGKAGNMAVSLDSFRRYYAPGGPAWPYERQALVKLRPIAGDMNLGAHLCALRDEFVYTGQRFDVTAMRAMREKQVRHLVTAGTFNAKYSPGGLVDVEYLVQALQINHAPADATLRSTNIREAMAALHAAGILDETDYTRLRKAHTFWRWAIDSLRVVRGNAHDVTFPPYPSEEFSFLARRLRYASDTEKLYHDLNSYAVDVQEMNKRLLG